MRLKQKRNQAVQPTNGKMDWTDHSQKKKYKWLTNIENYKKKENVLGLLLITVRMTIINKTNNCNSGDDIEKEESILNVREGQTGKKRWLRCQWGGVRFPKNVQD